MSDMSEMSEFELSRVYAKGWSEGRASRLSLDTASLEADLAALNPYQADKERQRWSTGFKDGIRRNEEVGRGAKGRTAPRKSQK